MIHASQHRVADIRAGFATSDGLRRVLTKIFDYGPRGWRELPEAKQLAEYVIERYRPLSRAWGRDPADVGYAAFLALRAESLLWTDDPWAVVTSAVQRSITAEEHADRLLTSPDTASRPERRPLYNPVRAGDDGEFLFDQVAPAATLSRDGSLDRVVLSAAFVLGALGWPEEEAASVVGYIADRAADCPSRKAAQDALRRDTAACGSFGLEHRLWTATLRLLLGDRNEIGLLARLLVREPVNEIAIAPGFASLAAEVMW